MNNKQRTKKKYGQHFLIDDNIADQIVDYAGISPDNTVLEIGPGKGILTERLLERTGNVTAVEIDRNLIKYLKKKFLGSKGLNLVEADILKTDLNQLFEDVRGKIKVVSNLPYYISTPIVELLCKNTKLISDAVLMIQKEVASRLIAVPGSKEFGLTTLNLGLYAKGRAVMDIKPDAFNPPPAVMSSVILLVFSDKMLYPLESEVMFRTLTGIAFRQRRKMMRNTVVPYLVSLGISNDEITDILNASGIDTSARPETINVADFVNLSNAVVKAIT
ncbi:16S rRNA (adenine(1518)-N(6)/adenine(1519)-N(6))-dimethyltransferase RsmA [Candidatus Latescibacterota bacterium]